MTDPDTRGQESSGRQPESCLATLYTPLYTYPHRIDHTPHAPIPAGVAETVRAGMATPTPRPDSGFAMTHEDEQDFT